MKLGYNYQMNQKMTSFIAGIIDCSKLTFPEQDSVKLNKNYQMYQKMTQFRDVCKLIHLEPLSLSYFCFEILFVKKQCALRPNKKKIVCLISLAHH